jgi:hypothetical protein
MSLLVPWLSSFGNCKCAFSCCILFHNEWSNFLVESCCTTTSRTTLKPDNDRLIACHCCGLNSLFVNKLVKELVLGCVPYRFINARTINALDWYVAWINIII